MGILFMDEGVSGYLTELAEAQHADAVLDDMEARAAEHGFPIVGRSVGRLLELMTRAIGAQRVMELGSGYGYSAYWFARGVGADGEVICTDGDADNATRAEDYLSRAGLWSVVRYHVGDALTSFAAQDGDFDIVYCDVDKSGYPDCWRAARERIRIGGLYLCDNTLWDGNVVTGRDREGAQGLDGGDPGAQPARGSRRSLRLDHLAGP
jgi:caffeoyl-CoA O-methyltransferase